MFKVVIQKFIVLNDSYDAILSYWVNLLSSIVPLSIDILICFYLEGNIYSREKYFCVKNFLLVKLAISRSSVVMKEKTEEEKEVMRTMKRNETAFTESVLSMDERK
jgi:hypothetical protein